MAAPTVVPDALYKWYRSAYGPALSFNPDWLDACVQYLLVRARAHASRPSLTHRTHIAPPALPQEHEPAARASVPGLIKAVEVQLLSSDLATSVLPPSAQGETATTTGTLFPSSSFSSSSSSCTTATAAKRGADDDDDKAKLDTQKKGGILVQVIEVDDVAHTALSLVDILSEQREARKIANKAQPAGARGGGRIMDLNEDDHDHNNDDHDHDGGGGGRPGGDPDAEAKRRAHAAGKGGAGNPTFPRGSGRFVLTDGGPAQWTAFELDRIEGLGLQQIKLGTKVRFTLPPLFFFCWLVDGRVDSVN